MRKWDISGVELYNRYTEVLTGYVTDVLASWRIVPVQALAWWLASDWAGMDWRDLILVVVVAWGFYPPLYIFTRLTLNRGDAYNFRPIHSDSANLIARAVSNCASFAIASSGSIAGVVAGIGAGVVIAVAGTIDKKLAFRGTGKNI